MPLCGYCREPVPSHDLKRAGLELNGEMACSNCRRPKEIKMAEKTKAGDRTKVAAVNIYEVKTADGGTDHELEFEGSWNGLDVRFKTTFDQVREFFTQRREEGESKPLRSVK